MFLGRFTGVTALPSPARTQSISSLVRRAASPAIPSRIFSQHHLKLHHNAHQSSRVLQCQFSSAVSQNAGARFAPRHVPRSKKPPPPPPLEPEPEFDIAMTKEKTQEPGSGLMKLFLAITVPILFLSQSDEVARFQIPADAVRKALKLEPNAKPTPAAYDYYIYNYKPELAFWLELGQAMKRNFSFVPANFTGNTPDEPFRWWTYLTSEFNHGGVLHLFFCYTALKAFAPPLIQLYGSGVTTTCFVAGGIIAHVLVGYYEKTTNPILKLSPSETKQRAEAGFTKEEKRQFFNAYSWHMGSSTSLMTIGTLCAIVYPAMELNLMFIPVGIPIRTAIGLFAAFDLGGMIWGYGLPIGHSGHIGGCIAGFILYQFWIRKLPTVMQRRIHQLMREKGIKI